MLKYFFFTFFIIITIGYGIANYHEPTESHAASVTSGHGIVAGSVAPMLTVEQQGKDVILHFTIMNQTEHSVKYTFPTSQRFDYIITSPSGEVVEKYSDGRMFVQYVSTLTLKPGQSLSYHPIVKNLEKGDYLVTFWLTAKEDTFKTTAAFTIK